MDDTNQPSKVFRLARRLLDIIEGDGEATATTYDAFEVCLMELVLEVTRRDPAMSDRHHLHWSSHDDDDRSYLDRRRAVVRRFPRFGMYNDVLPITKEIAAAQPSVGDAIDDVADIACELSAALNALRAHGEPEAWLTLMASYQYHWAAHAIGLLRFIRAERKGA